MRNPQSDTNLKTLGHSLSPHKTRILGPIFALLLSILLAACGSASLDPTRPSTDSGSPEWSGVAIGYEEGSAKLQTTSVGGNIVITGSGNDIWDTRDEFYYIYTTLEGDGVMSVRLDGFIANDAWAKAGLMIRESLDPEARNALIHISARNGSVFQARLATGDRTVNSAGRNASAVPGDWLRLTRKGTELTGEISANGQDWVKVGTYNLDLGSSALIGLAVTSHEPEAKATARFSNLVYRFGGVSSPDGEPEPEPEPSEPTPPDPPPVASPPTTPPSPTPPVAPPTTPPATPSPPTTPPDQRYVLPQATLYVATNGNDQNSGRSESQPLRTLTKAASIVRPGDVVYIRGGVYPIEVKFKTSGTPTAPIVWASYPGEWAILDGSNRRKGQDQDRVWIDGASYNVFANFEVRNGPRQGIYLFNGANNNVLTGLVSHGHNGSGIQNVNSSRNRFEYLMVYDNYDSVNASGKPGEDADGIGLSSGDRNVISHVVSYHNSDDGFDAWKSTNTIIEYSIAYDNGYGTYGNGNGFKAGGGIDNYTVVRNSIAFNNRAVGFTFNSGRHISFINNTGFNNRTYNFLGHDTTTFMNNLSLQGTITVTYSSQTTNSWNLGISSTNTVISTNPSSPDFLSLASGSAAIDVGTNAGYTYSGRAPDLGALEYGTRIASLGNLTR